MNDTLILVLLISMVVIPIVGLTVYFAYQAWLKTVAVRCIFMSSDRKIQSCKLKVKDGTVSYGEKSYVLNKDLFMIGKGNWPTYYFKIEDAKPLNMLDFPSSGLGSEELDAKINGKFMKDLLGAFERKIDAATMVMIFGIATAAGIGAVIYLMMDKFTQMQALLTEIREILRLVGGV